MRALLQRVSSASVSVNGALVGTIGPGLLVLLGVGQGDTIGEVLQLADKVAHLRIFGDQAGKFNLSLLDVHGAALVVSQFTLYGNTSKGRRPSFVAAAAPDVAAPLVEAFGATLRAKGIAVASGVFGAHMEVSLLNDGPVTLLLDTATL